MIFFSALLGFITVLEKLLLGTNLQVKFHNLTIQFKQEASNVKVLQINF